MKQTITDNNSSNLFLTGAIFLANFDFGSLLDYSVKAFVGGAIWMAFRLGSDYLSNKMKK